MDGNSEMIAFLQTAVGYSLTGLSSEQCLFLLHGNGANGKSTFVNTIRVLLGDYSKQTPVETLMVKRAGGASNDLARLRGVRFVSAVEAEAGQRMAESLVKQLTGGDAVAARFLYGEFFEFVPQFKLWLATNHRPEIQGMDEAIWRRIHLIPFEVTIPVVERDPKLGDKLCEGLVGILAWAVRGCLEWQRIGLCPPERVTAATQAYREESNPIKLFLDECCQIGSGKSVLVKLLYEAYEHWSLQNLVEAVSKSAFSTALSTMGYASDRTGHGGNRERLGLALKDNVEAELFSGAWASS